MGFHKSSIRAVVFDYGNTLVEFGPTQIVFADTALGNALEKFYGKPDMRRLREIRARDRLAPYQGSPPTYRESDLVGITRNLVQELYGVDPSGEELAALVQSRSDTFVRLVRAPDYLPGLLTSLARSFRLGLLSNYPDGNAIRRSLQALRIDRCFHSVVVSADIGLVKPHPVPFLTILGQLGVKASQALLVGDNWLADVQGGKQAGLRVFQTRQWEPPEDMPRRPGDLEPDRVISHLTELEAALDSA